MEHVAAIISLCDLVICDDSGPGHLASNLGIPTIVNTRPSSSWHWHKANLEQGFYRSTTANPFTESWRKTLQNASQMAEKAAYEKRGLKPPSHIGGGDKMSLGASRSAAACRAARGSAEGATSQHSREKPSTQPSAAEALGGEGRGGEQGAACEQGV